MSSALMEWTDSTMDTTRAMIHGAIEEAVGEGISVNRPDADTLIAQAQALGIAPLHLRAWIYDHHPHLSAGDDWSAAALEAWAAKHAPPKAAEDAAAPERLRALELFAWVGEDEYGSGDIGVRQGMVPAGFIPLVAIQRDKIDRQGLAEAMNYQAAVYGKKIYLCRFTFERVLYSTLPGEELA
jgi:hypothetical protein